MKTISVGELQKNPTQMLREVKAGERYTITDHGEPIAEVIPRQGPQWVPAEVVNEVIQEFGANPQWAAELAADRAAVEINDPWQRSR